MKQWLLSIVMCGAFAGIAFGSGPVEESTATSSTSTLSWSPAVVTQAKTDNLAHPFLSMSELVYREIFTDMFIKGEVAELASLLTTCHKFSDQLNLTGVQSAFREAIQAPLLPNEMDDDIMGRLDDETREECRHPLVRMVNYWKRQPLDKGNMAHLIRVRLMIKPENIARLVQIDLGQGLWGMTDKAKALALAAHAHQIFTEKMSHGNALYILNVQQSSLALSKYGKLGDACKHFFTDQMDGMVQSVIIEGAFQSSRSLIDYPALGVACKKYFFSDATHRMMMMYNIFGWVINSSRTPAEIERLGALCNDHFFTNERDTGLQGFVVRDVLTLSAEKLQKLVELCGARPNDKDYQRSGFITDFAAECLAEAR